MNALILTQTQHATQRLTALLERQGYAVEVFDDAERLLDAYGQETAAVVVAEMEPGPPGARLLQRLREALGAGSRLLALVPGADAEAVQAARDAGAHDVLDVPGGEFDADTVRVAGLIENASDAIIGQDLDARITLWNAAAEQLFGFAKAEALGQPIELIVPGDRLSELAHLQTTVLQGGRVGPFETVRRRQDGGYVEVAVTLSPVRERRGRIVGLSTIARDITAQKRVADELAESQARAQAILDTTVDAIITIDDRGRIESFNKAAEALFGYEEREVLGQNISILMPSPYREAHDDYIDAYKRTGVRKIIGIGREVVAQRRDGTVFPIDLAVSEVPLGDRRIFTGIIRDQSVRKRLEREVLEVSAQERQRIGQDLHDGLGSHLTGVALSCKALARRLGRGKEVTQEELDEIAHLVQEGVQQARLLSRGLNPAGVADLGLQTALQELAVTTRRLTGVACSFEGDEAAPRLQPEVTNHLYRIAQEAVNNAVKHARADHVWIRLSATPGSIALFIRDDGVGLPETLNPAEGIGHRVMQYRAHVIGASYALANAPGGGAIVTCTLPLTETNTVVAPNLLG